MVMDIHQLTIDIHEWHRRNYPSGTAGSALLSIGEELGELMRAELKQAGNIRGSREHWQAEKFKEAGDVLIGVIEYACWVKMEDCVQSSFSGMERGEHKDAITVSDERILHLLGYEVGRLMQLFGTTNFNQSSHLNSGWSIYQICWLLGAYCDHNKFDVMDVLMQRWNTISKRDFIVNPETGGREQETDHVIHYVSAVIEGKGTAG